ncbi:3562_t:CDS:2 [Funneliformis caledonium]|uniref:3562_t:CDS:1 n=1 Tax=Funneliformis caledonium TaxID=1117310 RepID=A0A9N8WG18_9GLOM|nr:3562_t:CDS:2 [Funneliformis caledonium]
MFETNPYASGLPQSIELQDLLMCESLFDEFTTTNNLSNNPNTTQPPSTTMSEFEAQIQAMLAANSNNIESSNDGHNQIFNNYQYPVSTLPTDTLFNSSDILASLNSHDSFLNSPSSYTTIDDNCSLDTLSPPQFNSLQDFTISPIDANVQEFCQDSSMEGSPFELLTSKNDLDALNLIASQQFDNAKKRANLTFDRDSISPDKSSKKKRKNLNSVIGKSIKKSSTGLKSSGHPTSTSGTEFVKGELNSSDGTQSIVVPSSPVISSDTSNYATNSMLAFNQGAWNQSAQTVNPSATSFVPDGMIEFTNIPLLVARDSSPAAKLPINRLKSTISNAQPQQNFQSQPNKQQKKVAHNAIERRYRNNINDRINDLKNVVPALCHLKSKDDDEVSEVDGIPAATKLNKATILRKATEYINYLKNSNQKLKRENDTLRKLIEALPGGTELYNAYMTEQVANSNEHNEHTGQYTPPTSAESSPSSSHPGSPHQQDYDYSTPPTPPTGNTGSRALMALFISFNASDGTLTIDIWYLIRIFTFLMCLTYIIRPSLFSSQPRRLRKSNSIITSVLTAKTKDAKALYRSLSSLSNGPPSNLLELIIGLISESIKFSLRRFMGWDITGGYTLTDVEERLMEVSLWGRIGEVELCGGNDKASRLSIFYTCLRTINLLESSYTTRKHIYLSPSRIYANAALQSYIGLSSFPFLAEKAASQFWKLAKKEMGHGSGKEEKWLEIALNSDHQSEMWKGVVNRISDYIFLYSKRKNDEKSHIGLMKNITIPLTLVTDVQALIYLKQAFYNFISLKYTGKKKSSKNQQNQQPFSFVEIVRDTTPNSLTHWYALVGCSIEAFSSGHNSLGKNFVNRLKDYPTIKSDENNYNKQIIAMGLLSYALLMHGKVEASIRCADKVSLAMAKRKEQRSDDGSVEGKIELLDELNNSFEIIQMIHDVQDLAEFCVGWIVLEARSLSWKIVEGLASSSDSTKSSAKGEKENASSTNLPSTTTSNSLTTMTNKTTTSTSNITLPDVLDRERLQNTIILWIRCLRRLSKNSVFEGITKLRETFIKKLVILERIVSGDYDDSDDDLELSSGECECELLDDENNCPHKRNLDDNSRSLGESENRAIKAWSILKGM